MNVYYYISHFTFHISHFTFHISIGFTRFIRGNIFFTRWSQNITAYDMGGVGGIGSGVSTCTPNTHEDKT